MKSKIYSFLIALLGSIIVCHASIRDSVIIQGTFTDSTIANKALFEVAVMQNNAKMAWPSYSEVYQVKAVDGRFRLAIPSESDLFYVSLAKGVGDTRDKLLYYVGQEAVFLFQPGDNITLKINKDNSLRFSGRGSEKMRCQQKIYESGAIAPAFQSRLIELHNIHDFQGIYRSIIPFLKNSLQAKLDLTQSYPSLDSTVRDRIIADCYGLTFHQFYKDFTFLSNPEQKIHAQIFCNNELSSLPKYPLNSQSSSSYYLPQTLYNLVLAELRLRNNHRKDIPYNDLYELIKSKYSEELRDQISLISLFEYTNRTGIVDNAQKVLNEMGFNRSQKMLAEWIGKTKTGNPAYDFQLKNEKGQVLKLKDFKGKVLILDFWFYGCFGCRFMPAGLRPVVDAFKGNKNVVFLSVNVDDLQRRWQAGLKSGDYTLKEQVEISTAPEGFQHPLLKHYNYKAFPQLLVIGKDGKNISSNPPDPRGNSGEKLIAMIKEALAQ